MGLALGGIYGFATSLFILAFGHYTGVRSVALFSSARFWGEFALALSTSFWEVLLFYCLIENVVTRKLQARPLIQQIGWSVALIMLFYVPNILLRSPAISAFSQLFLLTIFVTGQALVFYRWRNGYTLVLSQAFWGMVLLTHMGM